MSKVQYVLSIDQDRDPMLNIRDRYDIVDVDTGRIMATVYDDRGRAERLKGLLQRLYDIRQRANAQTC